MRVKELRFNNDGLTWLRWNVEGDKFKVTEGDGRSWKLDRNQAHLLYLYLKEHLDL